TATIANETQFYFGPMAGMIPFIEAGSVKALAGGGDARAPSPPPAPTPAGAGAPQNKAHGRGGPEGPAPTPGASLTTSCAAAAEAAKSPEVIAGLRVQGIEPASSGPREFAAFIQEQLQLHKKLVEDVDLKLGQ